MKLEVGKTALLHGVHTGNLYRCPRGAPGMCVAEVPFCSKELHGSNQTKF